MKVNSALWPKVGIASY